MRTSPLVALAVGLAALHSPRPALAAGAVVGRGTGAVVISGARTAVAAAPDRMTRWLQVTVAGNQSGFLWLLPAAPGARVDLVSDAWLDALDDATAPTVLAPASRAPCDAGTAADQLLRGPLPPSASPVASGVAVDPATLAALVAAGGAALSPSQTTAFDGVFQAGLDVVVLDYDVQAGAATTHSVRVVEGAMRSLDVPAAGGSVPYTDTTTFVIASARASLGPTSLSLDPATIEWEADGVSTYSSAREQALEAGLGEAWLTDSAMTGRFFDVLQLPGAPALPAVLARYFELASTAGDASLSPDACNAAAGALSSCTDPMASLCPAGQLAVAPGPSPCVAAPASATSAEPLSCGPNATDAAFALAGLSPGTVWLTRASGLLLPNEAYDAAVSVAPGPQIPAVVTASGYDASCGSAGCAGAPAAAPSSASSPPSDPSSLPSPSPTPATVAPVATAIAEGAAQAASDGCDGSSSDPSASSDSSGCDGATSSDDSSSDGCSGSTDDSDDSCSVQRSGHRFRGAAVRLLFLGLSAIAVVRRAARPRLRAVSPARRVA
jgi:hypothetical protein